ncbi:MAG TPA: amidohydrolase [Marinilabiliales bacterium]|nr:MAG: hypothetical protein A2W95_04700 [Bacteroidetes bacterium GWA2_40_14]OFX60170.1 MAG: hypothetical protein A2W84_11340 [Bacteroidetes bacterium GWC2_40_13]OFX71012.1 MAG: hypothetical protein A2W96_11090 [Bacteroidetes bacterium GWD2_40_43]OFX92304.1 MAG: hypothetical protein A2W97_10070 [Bacteroidetes bacterium GWE2_40_63]OFY22907.1 MAG: hypothetical protein A2W88_04055 [Bacteroidetes bacterium GWF2_40_13]OFZ30003.1 MAG: hypothetical protein A2437_00915 [Bacteroidetes bacterium RIFOXYC
MENLKVAFIQTDLAWENPSANIKTSDRWVDQVGTADVIVLPEMFNTGFTMNVASMAQSNSGQTIQWMKNKSLENNTSIMGSLIVRDEEKYYNRFVMAYPCADIRWYDKRHLFRMGGEHENFSAGNHQRVFKYFGWRIKPLICYDLRFPVWSRNRNNYDLLIYVANWPAPRREVWKTLLKARAIENQCYVIGVNRVGTDGMGITYAGDSMIIDFKGQVISELPEGEQGIGTATLSMSELRIFREKFPVHLDADDFEIKNSI